MIPPPASREESVHLAAESIVLPPGLILRGWREEDFPAIQRLSAAEGWPTPTRRPAEALAAWRASWPALVIAFPDPGAVAGFLRAISDGAVTMYVCEILVAPSYRGASLGRALLEACRRIVPAARLELIASSSSAKYYQRLGFRPFAGYRISPEEPFRE